MFIDLVCILLNQNSDTGGETKSKEENLIIEVTTFVQITSSMRTVWRDWNLRLTAHVQ